MSLQWGKLLQREVCLTIKLRIARGIECRPESGERNGCLRRVALSVSVATPRLGASVATAQRLKSAIPVSSAQEKEKN